MDLTEAEDIKKRWQEYTEELYKDLHDPDNHDGVITHLEPDILESEVKWALESITTNKVEVMEFQSSISNPKIWRCESAALNMLAHLENSAVATGLEKVSVHSYSKERQCQRMLKLPHNCTHLTWLGDFTFTFHFHALQKKMATHSSVFAWRTLGMEEPGGLLSMGSHRIGQDWSDLAAAAHAGKVMLKILQARIQQYMNRELSDVQAGFRKGRGTRD